MISNLTVNIISGAVILLCIVVVTIAAVRARIVTELKLRETLPNCKEVRRFPPFFDVLPSSIPDSEGKRVFLAHRRRIVKQTMVIVLVAMAIILAARLIPELI